MNKHPYYIIHDIEQYRNSTGEERRRLARKIAVAIGDPTALRVVLGLSPEEFANFYPDMTLPELSTDETIDSFIDTFGDPAMKGKDELDQIMTPAPTYNLGDLEAMPELDEAADDVDSIPTLDLNKKKDPVEPATPIYEIEPEEEIEEDKTDDNFNLCVKNGEYERALEIITEISLKNPKKSIYFADQMRFLKKLIEIKNKK